MVPTTMPIMVGNVGTDFCTTLGLAVLLLLPLVVEVLVRSVVIDRGGDVVPVGGAVAIGGDVDVGEEKVVVPVGGGEESDVDLDVVGAELAGGDVAGWDAAGGGMESKPGWIVGTKSKAKTILFREMASSTSAHAVELPMFWLINNQ